MKPIRFSHVYDEKNGRYRPCDGVSRVDQFYAVTYRECDCDIGNAKEAPDGEHYYHRNGSLTASSEHTAYSMAEGEKKIEKAVKICTADIDFRVCAIMGRGLTWRSFKKKVGMFRHDLYRLGTPAILGTGLCKYGILFYLHRSSEYRMPVLCHRMIVVQEIMSFFERNSFIRAIILT